MNWASLCKQAWPTVLWSSKWATAVHPTTKGFRLFTDQWFYRKYQKSNNTPPQTYRYLKINSMIAWRTPPPSRSWTETNTVIYTFAEMMKEQWGMMEYMTLEFRLWFSGLCMNKAFWNHCPPHGSLVIQKIFQWKRYTHRPLLAFWQQIIAVFLPDVQKLNWHNVMLHTVRPARIFQLWLLWYNKWHLRTHKYQ